jgi:hypothetical protein
MKKIHSFLYIGFCLAIVFQACKEPIEPLPELTVTTLQTTIEYGGTATISWAAINAISCTSDAGNIQGVKGSVTTPPLTKTTTYSFTATGPGGTVTATITIQVNAAPKPILKVTVDNDTIGKGKTVNVFIESENAVGITITGVTSGEVGPVNTNATFPTLNGTFTSWPILETTQFTFTATGIDGSITVAEPIVVIVPTRTDTICGRYWMRTTDSKYLSEGIWYTPNLDEDQLSRKTYFYKNGLCEVFKKDGSVVGGAYWKWLEKDLFVLGDDTCKYILTDTSFTLIKRNGTIVNVYKGFPIPTPK